jgi:hypothetical protein
MTNRILISCLAMASLLPADTLILRNGSTINGKFVSGDSRSIRFSTGSQVNTYDLVDIDNLRFEGAAAPPASAPPPPPPAASAPPPPPEAPPSAGNTLYGGVAIPAGTSIDQPVIVNGQTVIPRGADAVIMLSDSQQSGKIEGKAVLTLELRSITINGRTYDSTSSTVSRESGSRGARSAKVIGGTAALGAIIGAIAGGGRGAAIGAGSGAAVGTAAQVVTSGQKVKVPAETLLTFTLQNSLDL